MSPDDIPPEAPAPAAPAAPAALADALQWAVDRWHAEVAQRPLINVHRRTLDDTWRQVIRYCGGDPEALIGPSHDALLASDAGAETRARLAAEARRDDRMADALRQCVKALTDIYDPSIGFVQCFEPGLDALAAARAALAAQPQEPEQFDAAAELERLRAQHDECPLWPAEDTR